MPKKEKKPKKDKFYEREFYIDENPTRKSWFSHLKEVSQIQNDKRNEKDKRLPN